MKKRLNRMLSTLLICSMVMTMMPTTVFATNRKDAVMEEYAGGLCEHHPEHDDECGYSEGIAGTACSHEHTDDCYREVIKCTHRHDEDCYPDEIIWDDEATPSDADRWEPEDCPHMCEEDSECITKKLNCRHEHDDECGYSPATRGTPCEFECEICGVDDDMKTATPSNAKAVTVAGVQAMIDALPDVEEVRKGNAEKVKAQLDAIDDAKAELSDEEIDELDLSHYMEVAAALEQLLYGVATQSNAVMLADYDGPAIQLGTGGISGPTEEEEDGKGSYYAPNSYIYFGVNSGNSSTPIKWRVLDADTANDGTTSGMFLLSEYLLASDVQFRYNESIDNAYQGSAAQFWCGLFLSNRLNFSTVEQDAMLADNSGNILYYGRIAQNSANGTASVEIPSDLTAGTYTLKVFSEQYNGDYKTDYASEFQDITLTVNGKVSEQFNLTPGTTYWFDLSSAGIPGSTNNALPDTSRHYVPFTYVGSLNAYVLKPASENVLTSSEEASQATDKDAKYGYTYKHSLFIADYNVTHGISWKILNDNKLIFGTDFQNNRVAYTLRAPSAGHTYAYGDNGGSTPDNNEWDTILKKANQSTQTNVSDYIKNWEGIWSYGQDTANTSAFRQYRTIRGRIISAFSCNMEHKAESLPKYGFRPILEILDADTLGYDGLKTIVLDLNDGKIGDTTGTVNIVVKNSESFTAPESSGLSSPIGKTDTDFCWQGSDGNSYIPGAEVPAGVTSLTAQWTPMTYTVMLETNGGTIADGKDVTSYTYGEGAALPTANDMTREGYTFEGWYADSSFSGTPVTEISSDDMGNKEFYAKWMRNTTPIIPGDTVNYVVEHYKASDNGYTLEETEKLGDKIGSNVTAEPKIYTGYTYNPDAVGSVSMGTLKKISSAADIVTLKLYYDLTVYTVTVENDGNGSASAAPVSATMGEKITLTVTPNSGYRFKEWQIVSGDVTISDDTFTMPAGNVVVKAVFERKSSDGGGRDSSSDRDTSSSAIRKDPIKGRISSDRGIITGAANSTANDGYSHWMQNEHGWWLRFADNSYPKGRKHGMSGSAYAWELINGNWWAFDENGYAKTGWLRDEAFGGWFYMDPERGMQTGWVLIDGVWYYFHPVSDGRRGIMYAGQKTPDGYYVDEKGAWDGKEK